MRFYKMKNHIAYAKYLYRHKLEVYKACRLLRLPFHRALFHDMSKFTPHEWTAYTNSFYHPNGSKKSRHETSHHEKKEFDYAWNHHQKVNKHHWQYWVLILDSGEILPLEMPDTYVREMVADWIGAGKAITGRYEFFEWYRSNQEKMKLHYLTRLKVEQYLEHCHNVLVKKIY